MEQQRKKVLNHSCLIFFNCTNIYYELSSGEDKHYLNYSLLLLLLSCFSRVRRCATPQLASYQAPLSWDSPGKNTGVGCHFLLQCVKVKSESEVAQLCPTLSDLMDCSLPGSFAHGIFQAIIHNMWNKKQAKKQYTAYNPIYIKLNWSVYAWQHTPLFLPGESMDRAAWQATVHRVAQSQTWLKWLSMYTWI